MEKDTADPKTKNRTSLIEAMCEKKKEYGFSYGEIAKRSGLPLGTVQKVLGGFTKAPRHETIKALAGVLLPDQFMEQFYEKNSAQDPRGNRGEPLLQQPHGSSAPDRRESDTREGTDRLYTHASSSEMPDGMLLRESAPAYITGGPEGKRQGEYTIEDRNALPEDHPSELIDGVIYSMASPALRHQTISGMIYHQLCNYVEAHGGNCRPFIAPTDVRLDRDDRTMVVPDVFVICKPDDDRLDNEKYINGAPDLVIEVLSPSTRRKDMWVKLHKYEAAGVREYWIVDPQKERVIVYLFGEEYDVSIYGFDSEVPVGIYQGACRIDFRRILRELAWLQGE